MLTVIPLIVYGSSLLILYFIPDESKNMRLGKIEIGVLTFKEKVVPIIENMTLRPKLSGSVSLVIFV